MWALARGGQASLAQQPDRVSSFPLDQRRPAGQFSVSRRESRAGFSWRRIPFFPGHEDAGRFVEARIVDQRAAGDLTVRQDDFLVAPGYEARGENVSDLN